MKEIIPGIVHWTTFHEEIESEVESYYLAGIAPAAVLDPRVPAEGLEWFGGRRSPENVFLTNRLHYRHADQFERRFGTQVWCHSAGMHEFSEAMRVRAFEHGDHLPGGIQALKTAAICPEETAFLIPINDGVLAIGDALLCEKGELNFMPDALLGDDPAGVKEELRIHLRRHLEFEFDHLLMAHSKPILGNAKELLRQFLERPTT